MHTQMNYLKLTPFLVIILCCLHILLDKTNKTDNTQYIVHKIHSDNIKGGRETDSVLLGTWGNDQSTGNCILWIVKDSIYFIDSDIWCDYFISKDTIIMFYENNEYLKVNYRIINDSLFLKNENLSVGYGKCNQ